MGVYQKYRDKKGKPCGPWFVKYPHARNPATGKIKYRIQKASHSKKLADKFFRKKEDDFFRKDQQGLAIQEPKPKIAFKAMIEWYLGQDVVKAKKSYSNDQHRSRVLIENFRKKLADEISQTQVRNYQVRRQKQKTWRGDFVKPATINREIALMRASYYLAMDEGLVTKNPCRKIRLLKENNVRDRILSVTEFDAFCSELTPVAQRIVKTAYHTGMRKSEIFSLTVDKVHLNNRYIDLDENSTKDFEKRRIYFGKELYSILKELSGLRKRLRVTHKYVFIRNNGQPVKSIRTAFENACQRTGIKNFRFHDLRHIYNTEMRKAGVHDTITMKQTGHATLQMFMRYNTIDEDDFKDAVQKREAYISQKKSECSLCAP